MKRTNIKTCFHFEYQCRNSVSSLILTIRNWFIGPAVKYSLKYKEITGNLTQNVQETTNFHNPDFHKISSILLAKYRLLGNYTTQLSKNILVLPF